MTRQEAIQRPFSIWNIEPFDDEPAHGLFGRLVAEEEHGSSRVYANEIGVNGRDIVPAEQLEVILQLPIPEEWRVRLKNATPFFEGSTVIIAGQRFGDRQWAVSRRRFCPGCLAEEAYHRTWWDILAIGDCPLHGVPLQDSGEDGLALKWWWPHIDHTPKGEYLGRRIARVAPRQTLENYILGRLGFIDCFASPLLDGSSLKSMIDACEIIGRLLENPWSQSTPSTSPRDREIGFDALSSGPAHLVAALRNWMRREVPEAARRRGYDVAFGWINDRRHELSGEISELFQKAMRKSVAAENRTFPGEITDANFHDTEIGIVALAQELGIVRRGVNAIAARLGLLPEREWYRARVHFDFKQASLIREFMEDLVTTQEATAILGLPKFQLTPLIRAGFLERVSNVSGHGGRGSRFMRSQVQLLWTDIVDRVPEGRGPGTISLITYARALGVEPGQVAALVSKREVVPVCRKPGKSGFMSLRFRPQLENSGVPAVPCPAPLAKSSDLPASARP